MLAHSPGDATCLYELVAVTPSTSGAAEVSDTQTLTSSRVSSICSVTPPPDRDVTGFLSTDVTQTVHRDVIAAAPRPLQLATPPDSVLLWPVVPPPAPPRESPTGRESTPGPVMSPPCPAVATQLSLLPLTSTAAKLFRHNVCRYSFPGHSQRY